MAYPTQECVQTDIQKLRIKLTTQNAIWVSDQKRSTGMSVTKLINQIIGAARQGEQDGKVCKTNTPS